MKPICDAFLSCCALLGLLGAGQTAMAQGYEYFDAGVVSYGPINCSVRSDASNFHFNFPLVSIPAPDISLAALFFQGIAVHRYDAKESH